MCVEGVDNCALWAGYCAFRCGTLRLGVDIVCAGADICACRGCRYHALGANTVLLGVHSVPIGAFIACV